MPGGLTRDRRLGRHHGRIDAARRRQQGHLGAAEARSARSACCPRAPQPSSSAARAATCRAGPPTTCSGWAATSSAPKAWSACCAASSSGSPRSPAWPRCPSCPFCFACLTAQTQNVPGLPRPEPARSRWTSPKASSCRSSSTATGPAAWPRPWPCCSGSPSKVRDRISADMWRTLSHLMVDLMADLTAMAMLSPIGQDARRGQPG